MLSVSVDPKRHRLAKCCFRRSILLLHHRSILLLHHSSQPEAEGEELLGEEEEQKREELWEFEYLVTLNDQWVRWIYISIAPPPQFIDSIDCFDPLLRQRRRHIGAARLAYKQIQVNWGAAGFRDTKHYNVYIS